MPRTDAIIENPTHSTFPGQITAGARKTAAGSSPAGIGGEPLQRLQLAPLVQRARGEFAEMPGMQLTLPQAARLWGIDPTTCQRLLGVLVEMGFLRQRGDRFSRGAAT